MPGTGSFSHGCIWHGPFWPRLKRIISGFEIGLWLRSRLFKLLIWAGWNHPKLRWHSAGCSLIYPFMPDHLSPTPSDPVPLRERSLQDAMRADLEAIGKTRMPFGKFGPTHFPPEGLPIHDLPAEYLAWFANKAGWPKGRLGQLLQMVYQMKVDGSDAVFDPFRRRAGGRSKLRPDRPREFTFPDPSEAVPPGH